jgi:hypothetical protein
LKTQRILSSLLLTIGLLLANVSIAFAMPTFPSSFYGTVKVNGANAPDDAIVSARINGVEYAYTTVGLYEGKTVYSLEVPADDSSTPGVIEGGQTGNTVVFYINGMLASPTGAWNGGSNVSLNLTVAAATNHAPVANAQSVSTPEDNAKAITLTATDADGNPLAYSVVAGPLHGTLSGSAPALTYTPAANYNGPDSFTFKVNDGTVDSPIATVSITVSALNYAPIANPDACNRLAGTMLYGSTVLANDTDPDGDTLTAVLVGDPTHASGFTFTSDGTFVYTPVADYSGIDSFTYKAYDGLLYSNSASVTITVTAVNKAPIITEGASTNVSMSQNGSPSPFNLNLHATDVDGDAITWSINTPAGHGTASASGTGTSKAISYTPVHDYIGSDSFDVQVSDGNGGTDTITVNVTITAVEPTRFTIFLPLVFSQ